MLLRKSGSLLRATMVRRFRPHYKISSALSPHHHPQTPQFLLNMLPYALFLAKSAVSIIETVMLPVAIAVSRFEAETLRIPPSLHFISVGANEQQLCMEAGMFVAALLKSFVTIPLLEWRGNRHYDQPRPPFLLRCAERYLLHFVQFYALIVIVSTLHNGEE